MLESYSIVTGGDHRTIGVRLCAVILSSIAIILSAFHFWPFAENGAWRIFCPSNSAVLIWIIFTTVLLLLRSTQSIINISLPHLSVFGYLCINVLSIAFAPDAGRAGKFAIKLALMLIGGYTLFTSAIFSKASLKLVYFSTTVALVITICSCIGARFVYGSEEFGFFDNPLKYGTFIGILAPLCGAYFFTNPTIAKRFIGAVIVIGALISSSSLGALAAIGAGLVALVVIVQDWSVRLFTAGCIVCGILFITLLHPTPVSGSLREDIRLAENDGVNLKQRYIEWQAQINLLEKRAVTGTGTGCINAYRSTFYYRLPKLNTLKAFDQNGWLASGAELGVFGIVCFCWIVMHYGRLALIQIKVAGRDISKAASRFAVVNFIGLITTCVANMFSSVQYNGVLIVFILVLALITRTELLFGDYECE